MAALTAEVAAGCVYVGVHYVSDVAAGAVIGIAAGGVAWLLLGLPVAIRVTTAADRLLRKARLRPAVA